MKRLVELIQEFDDGTSELGADNQQPELGAP
jgi:hypothetical protein